MTRPIEFRAQKADTGEFVYGDLVKNSWGCFLIEHFSIDNGKIVSSIQHQVLPETVGQFTGLLDRNGKKIFEGDFITIGNSDFGFIQTKGGNPILYEVKTEGCDYTLYRNDIQLNWGRLSRVEEIGFTVFSVIGTIHDKPEKP